MNLAVSAGPCIIDGIDDQGWAICFTPLLRRSQALVFIFISLEVHNLILFFEVLCKQKTVLSADIGLAYRRNRVLVNRI